MVDIAGTVKSFPDAVRFFQNKVNLPTMRWNDLMAAQHAPAFVVAGATQEALLVDMRGAVEAAIADGESIEQFRSRFKEIVARHGWTGWTGEDTPGGQAWRTRVIYETNLRTSYMAGRYEQLKNFPYWKYKHNTRGPGAREQHQQWDGLIVSRDSDWWDTHYPPNGWGCRCSVIGVSDARMRAQGLEESDPGPDQGKGVPKEWRYNVGEAGFGKSVAADIIQAERGGRISSLDQRGPADFNRPDEVPFEQSTTSLAPHAENANELREQFQDAIGGESAIWRDPTGARISITDAIIEHWEEDVKRLSAGRERYLPFLREAVEEPFEIWVNWGRNDLTGKVSLRRRYIKGVQVGKNKIVTLIADAVGGKWVSFNNFTGGGTGKGLRQGLLVWPR